MIKVFCIDGYTTPSFVDWEDMPGLDEEWSPSSEYVFKKIQKFCNTDMAKPCHTIVHESDNPADTWQIVFWCDEDATLKPHEVSFKYLHRQGIQRFFNKIVAVAQDVNQDFISINADMELVIKKRIESKTYQFPLTTVRSA